MTLQQVRQIPYPEFVMWKRFYILEPWGFENTETQVSRILAQVFNTQARKRSDLKKPSHWVRDMRSALLQAIAKFRYQQAHPSAEREWIDTTEPEGKDQATAKVIEGLRAIFGPRLKDKRKK